MTTPSSTSSATLKNELVHERDYQTRDEARAECSSSSRSSIIDSGCIRQLGYVSPEQFETHNPVPLEVSTESGVAHPDPLFPLVQGILPTGCGRRLAIHHGKESRPLFFIPYRLLPAQVRAPE